MTFFFQRKLSPFCNSDHLSEMPFAPVMFSSYISSFRKQIATYMYKYDVLFDNQLLKSYNP